MNNDYDDSGLSSAAQNLSLVGQVPSAILNPGGFSIKFDELLDDPLFTFNPANDYAYTALPPAAVRVLIPQYAGADKINWGVNCSTIDLELVDFNAKKVSPPAPKGGDGDAVLVTWKTVNEDNVSHFEVERSTDGKTFTTIANVTARNTKVTNSYSIVDEFPPTPKGGAATGTAASTSPPLGAGGAIYYRLKMIDLDGSINYSKTVSVDNNGKNGRSLKITPSVSSDVVTIETTSSDAATLSFVDVLGRVVLTKQLNANANIVTTELSVSSLPNGVYTVVLSNITGQTVGKFAKQ